MRSMVCVKRVVPLVFFLATVGCTTAPRAPDPVKPMAPWATLSNPEFQSLLVSYAISNMPSSRDVALDKYLRSQTKTFDRYIAAKEVGADLALLESEALTEIEAKKSEVLQKSFMVATTTELEPYDRNAKAFPIFGLFNENIGFRFFSGDVRSSPSHLGIDVAAAQYGFQDAKIWMSKKGWFVPADQEQATRYLEALSRSGARKDMTTVIVFHLGRCDQDPGNKEALVCDGVIDRIYGYASRRDVLPENQPLVEFIKHD